MRGKEVRIRRAGREQALSLLFQVDVGGRPLSRVVETNQQGGLVTEALRPLVGGEMDEDLPLSLEEADREILQEAWHFAVELARGVLGHRAEIDAWLNKLAVDWSVARMASVDRAILRLAAYEILYRDDIPASVSINEAVELAKRYGTADSAKFVNGILGSLVRQRRTTDNGQRTTE